MELGDEKPIRWVGSALDDLRDLSADAQDDLGYQMGRVQQGVDPDDWKPMKDVGTGCLEIRVRTSDGAFRAFYVARFGEAVYVLHCFQKKTQKTSKSDIELGRRRYKAAVAHAKERK
ncbi:type II toxin-antitoxin system RelE/ParE family toxin [Rhodococcus erythropolis]|uniref:type II toxin-antitoxin system RelE/ParE family toxin n=1 Tax=Rhodococcus erythropolis TaxID=1833 RepID=UPI002949D77B|nr:type II toxin-antitoxin system RelE/ParE family toxin [Rhodococcus erythropolis]MDV6278106.1 type II toxin-antitoxin system RelE/ParE family toxin [Rhodococcus erythropolis]